MIHIMVWMLFCTSAAAKWKLSTSLTVQATCTGSGKCIVGVRNLNSIVKYARNEVFHVGSSTLQLQSMVKFVYL